MSTRPNEYLAYYSVTGDFDAAAITAQLGISPTQAWTKGDIIHTRLRRPATFSRWSVESRLGPFATLEQQMGDVFVQLQPIKEKVVNLSKNYPGYMQLVGHFHESWPGLHFEKELVASLAEFELSVDFDFYHYYADKAEEC